LGRIRVLLEATRSRRGGHAARRAAVVLRSDGRVELITQASVGESARGTYSRGKAVWAEIALGEGDYLVAASLVRNTRGHVSGFFEVIDWTGRTLLRAVYRRLKIRRSSGDPSYSWAIERALEAFKLDRYVRRINMATGASIEQ